MGSIRCGYVYDLAQLVHQQGLAPVTIVAHSLGATFRCAIPAYTPRMCGAWWPSRAGPFATGARRAATKGIAIARAAGSRSSAPVGRLTRRYPTIEDAFRRMQEENKHLSPEQARHLTQHGVNQNEDGTYSWKFDNYIRSWPPYEMTTEEVEQLWPPSRARTPGVRQGELASNPETDGRLRHFRDARVALFEAPALGASRSAREFLAEVRGFL